MPRRLGHVVEWLASPLRPQPRPKYLRRYLGRDQRNLKPGTRQRDEQPSSFALFELVEVDLRDHDGIGRLSLEAIHRVHEQVTACPERVPVGGVACLSAKLGSGEV